MSEPIPESIPTSRDSKGQPARKKARHTTTPSALQAATLSHLMSKPDMEIKLPSGSSSHKPALPAPPEIVANVQGSSAGAGSGEFHVYKASRRREYERLKMMDQEVRGEREGEEFERERRERDGRDEERTRKNREKRMRKKGRGQGKGEGRGDTGEGKASVENGKWAGVKGLAVDEKAAEGDEGEERDKLDGDGKDRESAQETGLIIHDDD